MKHATIAAVAAVGVCLSGCASIVKGTTESVAITSPPTTGANCTLTNPGSSESWEVITPGTVSIQRSKHDLNVHCVKDGWQAADAVLPSNFEGWTVGNLIFGGVIGVGVDAATGAMNEYPHAFQVPMQPAAGSGGSGTRSDPGRGAGS
jgi:uncharacterized protein YceK